MIKLKWVSINSSGPQPSQSTKTPASRLGAAIKWVVGQATLPNLMHHSDPLILKHTNKTIIIGNYIHKGAVVLSSYFYHLNFPKVQGCHSDPATNFYPILVSSSAPVLSLCTCNTWYLWAISLMCNLLLASQGQAEDLKQTSPSAHCWPSLRELK